MGMNLATEEEHTKCETDTPSALWKCLRASCFLERKLFSWQMRLKFGTALVLVLTSYCIVHFYQLRPMFLHYPNVNHSYYQQRVTEGIRNFKPINFTKGIIREREIPLPVPRGARRTAICLVGGLRDFQLTGPSIQKFLLNTYGDADVFVHAPVDRDIHKLTILSGTSRLAGARLFVPQRLEESRVVYDVLTDKGSPYGLQGLLQYFNLVEGCVRLIENHESRHNFTYDWIVRTRLDSYWNAPMPPIESFEPSVYHVPYGSNYRGFNDRLGVGTRNTSMVALHRLSLLPAIHKTGLRHLNSESAFKAQCMVGNVTVVPKAFPFCIMSFRYYSDLMPVASTMSKDFLNGAKCRPCRPVLVGKEAQRFLKGIIGPIADPMLCDGFKGRDDDWEEVYDETGGPEFADVRKRMGRRPVASCVRDMQSFAKEWEMWSAPPVETLCAGLEASINESGSEGHQ